MMKKIVVIAMALSFNLCAFNGYAQDVVLKYSDLAFGKKKPKGKFNVYESKNGTVYKIGDHLTIGSPSTNKTFAYINQGDGFFTPIELIDVTSTGEKTELFKIIVSGTKKSGYRARFRAKGIIGIVNYGIDVENAIMTKELKSSGMSSDEALTELKKAKSMLDLELITQEEYNSKKKDLVKYIQ